MLAMVEEIRELRDSIDEIDLKMVELLAQRLRLVMRVGEIKRTRGLQVYDADRERDLLARVSSKAPAPLEPAMAERIFQCIIQESRDLEKRHVAQL
jgi:chorismate mutase